LKAGDSGIMKFYGLDTKGVSISGLKIINPKVQVGEYLKFEFDLKSEKWKTKQEGIQDQRKRL